ncbi:MAG: hypothetical protein HF314_05665 [Ignavibacteria bacterium]|jgi:hypothetical protein|nr:hypothetical protein [Ignavibacteria bacterium]MCU7502538.1 hypothetical protein [Ignavibacteria bacterium]MCU7515259.1 hypothetical protein [Ignavibacteria bacterium]
MQRDQKKYFEVLRRYERKFEPREADDYKMMLIRHKDDEDLDKQSLERLKELYQKYYVNRERKNYDDFFKKPEE